MPTSELGIPQGLTQEKRKTEAKVAAPAGGVWEAVGYLVRSSTVWDGGDGGLFDPLTPSVCGIFCCMTLICIE